MIDLSQIEKLDITGTIKSAHIEKPLRTFSCVVLRSESRMRYQDGADGKWKPVQPEHWERWKVLAETEQGAQKIAEYHFFMSSEIKVTAFHNDPKRFGELIEKK